ncbi:MAG: TetR/AcrR family transcriptional regulator, partial [Bacteroidales bacterium]|nr:TetR/AcrR family transcriptional regulator [Bacteroidales bacterium]
INEICQKAGVSKVTFYRYYTNKQELAIFIRDSMIQEGFSRFDEISGKEISFAEKIDLMTEWRREFFSGMSADFIEDVFSMEDIKERFRERLFNVIRSAQQKGDIRKEISPALVWLVTEKMNELVTEGKWKSAVKDYSEYQGQMRLMFYHGLLTK